MLKQLFLFLSLLMSISSIQSADTDHKMDEELQTSSSTWSRKMLAEVQSLANAKQADEEWVKLYQQNSKAEFIQKYIDTGGGRKVESFDIYSVLGIKQIDEQTMNLLDDRALCFLSILTNLDKNILPKTEQDYVFKRLQTLNSNSYYVRFSLFVSHRHAIGCPADPDKAFEYLKIAAIQYGVAQYWMAKSYEMGETTIKQNPEFAFKLFKEATDKGVWSAFNSLGRCYENGIGTSINRSLAIQNYRKAAELGYAMAQHSLGVCYFEGQEVTKNLGIAVQWFEIAAAGGHERAKKKIVAVKSALSPSTSSSIGTKNHLADLQKDGRDKKKRRLEDDQKNKD